MTIAKADRLFKVRGTDEEIALRLSNYFRLVGFTEAVPAEVVHLLCPGESGVEFEAASQATYGQSALEDLALKNRPSYIYAGTDGREWGSTNDLKLAVLR